MENNQISEITIVDPRCLKDGYTSVITVETLPIMSAVNLARDCRMQTWQLYRECFEPGIYAAFDGNTNSQKKLAEMWSAGEPTAKITFIGALPVQPTED